MDQVRFGSPGDTYAASSDERNQAAALTIDNAAYRRSNLNGGLFLKRSVMIVNSIDPAVVETKLGGSGIIQRVISRRTDAERLIKRLRRMSERPRAAAWLECEDSVGQLQAPMADARRTANFDALLMHA